MNVLIVYAHPEPQSLNGYLKDLAVRLLENQGHKVKVSDLYEMNFKAVADRNDFTELKNSEKFSLISEQNHAFQNGTFSEDIKAEQEKIAWADLIIYQYPLWWTDPPAILKGWFDRVWSYGFAYGPGVYDKGNLKGKKALISITHGGADLRNYGENALKGKMEERLFNMLHEKLFFAGMDVLEPVIFHSSAPEKERELQIEAFGEMLLAIDSRDVVAYHGLDYYAGVKA